MVTSLQSLPGDRCSWSFPQAVAGSELAQPRHLQMRKPRLAGRWPVHASKASVTAGPAVPLSWFPGQYPVFTPPWPREPQGLMCFLLGVGFGAVILLSKEPPFVGSRNSMTVECMYLFVS